jgi:hypothetical protein
VRRGTLRELTARRLAEKLAKLEPGAHAVWDGLCYIRGLGRGLDAEVYVEDASPGAPSSVGYINECLVKDAIPYIGHMKPSAREDAALQKDGSVIPIPDPGDPNDSYKPLRSNMAAFGLNDPIADTEPPADPWQHRSNTMKCATCMWFALKKPRLDFGRCRRHAPTLAGYPAVFSTDWCGDHKLDEGSLPQPGDSK